MPLLLLLNLEPNEIGFRLSTNQFVPAERALKFADAVVEIVRSECGPDARIEIVEMGRGSLYTRFLVTGAALATIYMAVDHAVHDLLSEGSELGQCVAEMVVENGVTKVSAMTCEGSIEVLRDQIPEVDKFLGGGSLKDDNESGGVRMNYVGLASIDRPTLAFGRFAYEGQVLFFVAEDGERGRVDIFDPPGSPPIDEPVLVELLATRGDQGGWADRGLRVLRWQRPPNDESEFDLAPGAGFDEMTTAEDLDEAEPTASFVQGQPRRAFTGEFANQREGLVFHGTNGQTYVLDRVVGSSPIELGTPYVVIGRAGMDFEETGHRLLYAQIVMPVSGE
ncbi:hypothetical protein [Aurantiacibacter flavus]|uniref:Uncharacterized protein n=1 Tax=Aurantiacibacter flavus TaxID=3145232 RepID=A0ABV0CWQ4_9SPHN